MIKIILATTLIILSQSSYAGLITGTFKGHTDDPSKKEVTIDVSFEQSALISEHKIDDHTKLYRGLDWIEYTLTIEDDIFEYHKLGNHSKQRVRSDVRITNDKPTGLQHISEHDQFQVLTHFYTSETNKIKHPTIHLT